ncbi:hypothetical protein PGTUg99_002502 [Puccinia graminis f. sp. tritici]|uniref:Uncharacterized protein n=1 Tax=Puccinia graminis f. sp. tritici TaxID=56615 RepID=A0A5B0P7S4_PUCGR|nr:hypothetical protein PGTUg99_002502 [Puccinia graminis f. sp. tritici]
MYMSQTLNLEFVRDPNLVHSSSCNLPSPTRTLKIPSCSPQNTHNIARSTYLETRTEHPEYRPSNLENHLRKLSPPTLKIKPSNLIHLTSQPGYSLPCFPAYPSQNSQDPQELFFYRWIVADRCGSSSVSFGSFGALPDPRRTPRALGFASERLESAPERSYSLQEPS